MTRDDTIKFATDAKFPIGFLLLANRDDWKCLERFAALASAAAVAAEREACARLCADYTDWCHEWGQDCNHMAANAAANECAAAIRARGEK